MCSRRGVSCWIITFHSPSPPGKQPSPHSPRCPPQGPNSPPAHHARLAFEPSGLVPLPLRHRAHSPRPLASPEPLLSSSHSCPHACPSRSEGSEGALFTISITAWPGPVARPRATPALICFCPSLVLRAGRGSIKFFELVNKCLTASRDLCPKSSHSSHLGLLTPQSLQHTQRLEFQKNFPTPFSCLPAASILKSGHRKSGLGFGVRSASPLAPGP